MVRLPLPAHGSPGDLADSVLDPPSPVRSLGHGALVRLNQEGRRIGRVGEPLSPSYPGEILIVLAGPVDVDAAKGTVPLFVRGLCATLRALHGPTRVSLGAPTMSRPVLIVRPWCLLAIPVLFQRSRHPNTWRGSDGEPAIDDLREEVLVDVLTAIANMWKPRRNRRQRALVAQMPDVEIVAEVTDAPGPDLAHTNGARRSAAGKDSAGLQSNR
jgi:hypothetical protein